MRCRPCDGSANRRKIGDAGIEPYAHDVRGVIRLSLTDPGQRGQRGTHVVLASRAGTRKPGVLEIGPQSYATTTSMPNSTIATASVKRPRRYEDKAPRYVFQPRACPIAMAASREPRYRRARPISTSLPGASLLVRPPHLHNRQTLWSAIGFRGWNHHRLFGFTLR